MPALPAEPITVGSTYLFADTLTRNGAVFDLTGATVFLLLRPPGGAAVLIRQAAVVNPGGGSVAYQAGTGDLYVAGLWRRAWRVLQTLQDGTPLDLRSRGTPFVVEDSP